MNNKLRPKKLNVLGIPYKIKYVKTSIEVDLMGRESLFGQIDFWSKTIRIFDDGKRPEEDILHTILHEVLHAISEQLQLPVLTDSEHHHHLDTLALALLDTLLRNKILVLNKPKRKKNGYN